MNNDTHAPPHNPPATEKPRLAYVSPPIGKHARDFKSAEASGGWLWMEKASIDKILTQCVDCASSTSLAVYMALTRLSSDKGNATEIATGMALLAKLSGVSKRSVVTAIAALEKLGLIRTLRAKSGKENAVNRYVLLAHRGGVSTHKAPSALNAVVKQNDDILCTTLKEKEEKGVTETPATDGANAPVSVAPLPSGKISIEQLGPIVPTKRRWNDGV